MKKKKIAVIIDWDNLRKGLFEAATRKDKNLKVNYFNPDTLKKLVESFIDEDEELFRIFLYLTKPYHPGKRILSLLNKNQQIKAKKVAKNQENFIKTIGICDFIAIRQGKLKFRGIDQNGNPIFIQKQVDMLMGLDIAHLSYNKLVDRILFFCGDSDLIPALKIARKNGLQVVLAYCPDIYEINIDELKLHSDIIRAQEFEKIFGNSSI